MRKRKQFVKFMPISDSSKLTALKEFIKRRGIDFVVGIQGDRIEPVDFALSVSADRLSDLAGEGKFSQRQLNLIKGALKRELNLEIEWLITPEEKGASIEAGLLELLDIRCPGFVTAVFVSPLKKEPVCVWVERSPKHRAEADMEAIKSVVQKFLTLYDVSESLIIDSDGLDLPSNLSILRRLKIHSPATTEELTELLRASGLIIPDSRWMQRMLDRLRKDGLVVRSKTGDYCLTEKAVALVPHGRNRSSSDVERSLALGRRKW